MRIVEKGEGELFSRLMDCTRGCALLYENIHEVFTPKFLKEHNVVNMLETSLVIKHDGEEVKLIVVTIM